jgi:spore coat protein CotH
VHKRLRVGIGSQRGRVSRALLLALTVLVGACADAALQLEQPLTDVPPAPAGGPCAYVPEDDLTLQLPTWNLEVSELGWDALHEDVYADVDVPAVVCIDGTSYAIELELQGSSTRKLAKKSFDLKFKKASPLHTWPYDDAAPSEPVAIRKLFLKAMGKDQSLVREALGFDLYRALGYATPNTGFANLRINGAYWGLYAVIEPVNDKYLAGHGYPEGGRLYKAVRKHGSRADFKPGRDLTRAFETELGVMMPVHDDDDDFDEDEAELPDGEEPNADENAIEPDTMQGEAPETDASDDEDERLVPDEYAALERFVETLQSTPLAQAEFDAHIDPLFSLAAYFDRMLWVAFTQNGDAIAQNFFLYHTIELGAEHWYQLPWDSDISFGADYRDVDSVIDSAVSPLVDGGNYFSRRMLQVPNLRSRYVERFRGVLDAQLLETEGFARLADYRARLQNDLQHDRARWNRETDAATAFDRISSFLTQRGAALRQALDAL